ncbi:MAG: DUF4340 domain-containing protein [Alphaproteobacteria bacterium]
MTPRSLMILAGATAIAVAGAIAAVVMQPNVAPPKEGRPVFAGLVDKINDVRSIEIIRTEESFTMNRKGDGWVMKDRYDYPVRFDKVKEALLTLGEMKTVEPATNKSELFNKLEVAPAGKDSTGGQITLKDGNGRVIASLLIGRRAYSRGPAALDQTYVRKPDENQAWLVKGAIDVGRRAVDWLARDIIDVNRDRVREVQVREPDGKMLVVRETGVEKGKFEIVDKPANAKVIADINVWTVAGLAEEVSLNEVKPAAEVGITGTEDPQAVVYSRDGLVITVRMRKIGDDTWATFETKVDAAQRELAKIKNDLRPIDAVRRQSDEINARAKGWAYQLQTHTLSRLNSKLADLVEFPKPDEKKQGS